MKKEWRKPQLNELNVKQTKADQYQCLIQE